MTALAAIHVKKKQLGLDDDTYRALLVRVTGKSSAGAMTADEHDAVLEELRRLGFKPGSKTARRRLEGRFAGKLQALWITAWHLGLVADRSDEALVSFAKRQTGIDHVRFLHDAGDARKAIEALKGWIARGAGVEWPADSDGGRAIQCAVIAAQLRLLGEPERDLGSVEHLPRLMQALGRRVRARRR